MNIDDALKAAVERFVAARPKTLALHERAKAVMPGGNTRTVLFTQPFPVRVERAENQMVHDVDGHSYTDFVGEYSAGVYGHSNPVIADAVAKAVAGGINFGAHHKVEVEFAEAVAERFGLERLRFTNSGTEANMMALAAARHFTGRSKVMAMRGGYHGGTLYFVGGQSPVNAPFEVVLARFNDIEATRALIHEHGKDLAALLVEPMLGSGGCIPASHDFLAMLRVETAAKGIVLVFDAVMTSRLGPNGYAKELGLKPDMTTLGKYIGGGMSFGCFGGRADIMDQFDPMKPGFLPHAGTFNNNTLTMNAGLAGITKIFTPEKAADLNTRGERLKASLNKLFQDYQANWQVTGIGSLLNLHPVAGVIARAEDAQAGDLRLRRLLFLHLLEQGVYIAERGYMALSLAITDADCEKLRAAVEQFLIRTRGMTA
ncbi:aspartate aminotransferase family protein [Aestuariivirga litoralis]|uniref:aspartate aminotransferase family protein n=1 Tax=Aestuariivirga litoralis TaxID=2650924 RepID=UPI0018C5F578|nr:aminotransferase class III-fold pyridoxal phosphate-dependent enzyme [Aestuariivirga litoralis]MBG1231286.1 aminotransferase class III-fold pyridoxal phosphate-dependent enzyme [Aestuariivirga litoralis]